MRSYFVCVLARAIMVGIRILPRPIGVFTIRTFANLAYFLDFRHRHVASVNLRIAFPELTDSQRASIARRSFQNTALNLLEISRFPLLDAENIASLVKYDSTKGLDNYKAAKSVGKGILYLTGHFSAWELLPAAHALYGYPLSFVTRPLDNVLFDHYLLSIRESVGNRVIRKKNAARTILKCLKEKESVGILMDQNTSLQEGIFTDFFGLPASTSTGIVLLALRTGAPILPGYLTPMHRGGYTIKFLPPFEAIRTGDRDRDIEINTRMINKILEGIIREQPESWLWGHKRWKYQPIENPQNIYGLNREELNRFLASSKIPRS